MKKAVIAIFFLYAGNVFSQSCVDSSSRFMLRSGSSKFFLQDTKVLKDSSVIMAGSVTENIGGLRELFLSKLDKYNNILFAKKINGFTSIARKILECHNGDLIIAATKSSYAHVNYWIFRISQLGDIIWQQEIENSPIFSTEITGYLSLFESQDGNIFLGMTGNQITEPIKEIASSYYYLYKFSGAGDPIWKTTLVQNDSYTNLINAINVKNGIVSVVTQQYMTGNYCTATDAKSVSILSFQENSGSFIEAKSYCLNFFGYGCLAGWSYYRHDAEFLPDGGIIVTGEVYPCTRKLFTLQTDPSFNIIHFFGYDYGNSNTLSSGLASVTPFGNISISNRGDAGSSFYYSLIDPNGSFLLQRKFKWPPGVANSSGYIHSAFRKSENFLTFTNFKDGEDEWLNVMEFKGNNTGGVNCTGKDTTFLTSFVNSVANVSFVVDTVRTNSFSPVPSQFILTDFIFERDEVCSSVSICDSLKITGPASVCLDDPIQSFSAIRNPGCNKEALWRIDPTAIVSMNTVNDTTVQVRFAKEWQGYLYAYSQSCGNLLDSIFVRVSPSSIPLDMGSDTSFCATTVLDAGEQFSSYRWQDNSTSRYFTVNTPGQYFVEATGACGVIARDTILFFTKSTLLDLGIDTCIAIFPQTLRADTGFKHYNWHNGSIANFLSIEAPGKYFVTTVNGCDEQFSDTLNIYKSIVPFSLGGNGWICADSSITLNAPTGYPYYEWQDGSTSSSFIATSESSYFVKVTDYCGQSFTDAFHVQKLNDDLNAGEDVTICQYAQVTLTATGNYSTFQWDDNVAGRSITVRPLQTTTYYLDAISTEGCLARDTVTVYLKDCPTSIYMPTAFTPNNDGKNDVLRPIAFAPLENYELSIYNRWGQRVFYSKDINQGWDGRLNGAGQPSSVFAWILTYSFYGKSLELIRGTSILIR